MTLMTHVTFQIVAHPATAVNLAVGMALVCYMSGAVMETQTAGMAAMRRTASVVQAGSSVRRALASCRTGYAMAEMTVRMVWMR